MAGDETFEARYSPMRSILLGALSLIFVLAGFWLVGAFGDVPSSSRRVPDWAIPIAGWVCLAFFTPVALLHLSKAFSPGLAVRIDETGMTMADYSDETILWTDFTAISSMNMLGTNMLQFEVVPERRATFSMFRRILWALNKPFNGKGGSLVINNTDRSHAELIAAIKHHAPPRMVQYLR